MPIGPLIPGNLTPVQADANPTRPDVVQGPAVDGFVVAPDVLQAILVALNGFKYLANLTIDRIGSLASMAVLQGAQANSLYFALDGGLYYFNTTPNTPQQLPWIVTGVGGTWVSLYATSLLDATASLRIRQQWVPNFQVLQSMPLISLHDVSTAVRGVDWTILQNTDSPNADLKATISDIAYGVRVRVRIQPLTITVASGHTVYIRARLVDGSTTLANWEYGYGTNGINYSQPILGEYIATGSESSSIELRLEFSGGNSSTPGGIALTSQCGPQTPQTEYQWGYYEILRKW